jgi:rod shape-determining protein MreD
MNGRRDRLRRGAVLLLLVVLHFGLRPWLGAGRAAPDFLLLALLVYAIGTRPGKAVVAGFLVGLLSDAVRPVAFGSAMLAYAVVGYLAAWGKAVFFAENPVVAAAFFFGGVVVRDLLVLVWGGGLSGRGLAWQLAFWTPLQGLATAIVGLAVLYVFRRWLGVRLTG